MFERGSVGWRGSHRAVHVNKTWGLTVSNHHSDTSENPEEVHVCAHALKTPCGSGGGGCRGYVRSSGGVCVCVYAVVYRSRAQP